jgi:uncharacterized protein (DUF1501 family)
MRGGATRRDFLRGAACAALAAQVPLFLRPERAGAARRPGGSPLLVVVFLRGGADGLALLPKLGDSALESARGALLADRPIPLPGQAFGLHPALEPLAPWIREEQLAAVCAVGLAEPQRSHFEAQDFCERGGARPGAHPQGWLARALNAGPVEPSAFRAIAATNGRPLALSGDSRALAFEAVDDLRVPGGAGASREALRRLFEPGAVHDPTSTIARAGRDALDAVDALRAAGALRPRELGGFEGRLGSQLETVARVARADLGLAAACVDVQGWDTHIRQGAAEGALARAAGELAKGLAAFLRALESRMDDVLVLVVTEFGRTVEPNGSGGTDHGRASVALALGGAVAGGRVYGHWPGVAPEAREDGRYLRVTTDGRHVLAEGARHLGAHDLERVLPGFDSLPTGLLRDA